MSREDEIRNIHARRRNILYLMERYLQDNGYFETAEVLKKESHLLLEDFELCDNIDLDAVYLEYAGYYRFRFGKDPRILRKVQTPQLKVDVAAGKRKKPIKPLTSPQGKEKSTTMQQQEKNGDEVDVNNDFQVTVTRIETKSVAFEGNGGEKPTNDTLARLQEIEHDFGCSIDDLPKCTEWRTLADLVKTTIFHEDLKLNWSDVYGNTKAVEILQEAVIAPIKYPQLFTNGLQPWRSVLIYGPPGSGKTMLARTLYAETRGQVTFFNATSSVVVSKWRGESEKILRVLFYMAQRQAPSIIFLDEIEGLTSKRDRPTDHESSKRFKNELLQLLDGLERQTHGVFILASTNLPWDIDDAFLRRFEKKLLVQLPNCAERSRLIRKLLPATIKVSKEKLEHLSEMTENFTGDEIRLACKEIAMETVRRLTRSAAAMTGGGGDGKRKQTNSRTNSCLTVTGQGDNGDDGEADTLLIRAFAKITPACLSLLPKYLDWQSKHGGGG